MRVHHVITRLIVGGAQENTLASVLGLRTRPGLEIRLLSGPTTGPEGSLESLVTAIPGLLTVVPSLVRPVHPARDLAAFLALHRIFRRERPRIVHTHSGKAGILGRLAARTARVPIIVHTIHGPSFGPFQGPIPNLVFRSAERLAARWTTHFVVVADAMARQYQGAGIGRPGRFTRVFSGFDLAPFLATSDRPATRERLGLAPSDFVIGKIARFAPLKGHDDLLRAAPDVLRDLPQARFLLVGDGPERASFEQALRRIPGLSRHFTFTGLVPPEAIPGLVGAMDVLIHLSRREGLARALPQALAAARPVVAYDLDGAGEVCVEGRTGCLIPAGDLEALRQRLGHLATHPDVREAMGRQGRAFVAENFPVERMVEALDQVYQRLDTAAPRVSGSGPADLLL